MYVSSSCRGNLKGGKKEQNDQNWVGIWISNRTFCDITKWNNSKLFRNIEGLCLIKMTKQIVKKICHIFWDTKIVLTEKKCARLTIALVLRGGKDVDVRSDVNLKLCDHQKLYLLVETCSLTPERLLGMCNGPLSKLSTKSYYKITWNYLQDFYNIVSHYILLNVCIVLRKK